MMIQVDNVKKVYTTKFGLNQVQALKNVSFDVKEGEFVAIMGESGSGKTTLLNILAGIDEASSGKVLIDGEDISKIGEAKKADYRRKNLGFVFQDFNLLDTLNVMDNIFLPLVLSNYGFAEMKSRLGEITSLLSIEDLINKYPYELSGGQMQRVALARALITRPKVVLADEPTGNLDSKASESIMKLFGKLNEEKKTILMVTHSVKAACYANRILFIKDGEVYHQIYKGNSSFEQIFEKISNALQIVYSGGDQNASY